MRLTRSVVKYVSSSSEETLRQALNSYLTEKIGVTSGEILKKMLYLNRSRFSQCLVVLPCISVSSGAVVRLVKTFVQYYRIVKF